MTQRGGGLLSELFSQRLGAMLALAAHRAGWSPNWLSIANLVVGIAGSALLVTWASRPPVGGTLHVLIGLCALLAWHLAYGLDCADGQLARVTGRTSPTGARLDILCDLVVQIGVVTAVVATAQAHAAWLPVWVIPVFAGTWLVNLITSILAGTSAAASLITSRSVLVRSVKLIRDYAFVITLCGVVVSFAPTWTPWLILLFIASNGSFLLVSVVQAARGAP